MERLHLEELHLYKSSRKDTTSDNQVQVHSTLLQHL